ncbi:MAG: hypothetical protein K8F25_07990 [Fimbriimonadaceae bacterium]|nr:hypothetical protein [Alphaproteobacteria bacterium]
MTAKSSEQYGERESQQRFQKLVDIALKSPPKPIKSMGKKGVPAQSKKRQKAAAKAR